MEQPIVPITDTQLLRSVLQRLDPLQLEELCLYFPARSDLGKALRSRLADWRADYTPLAAEKEPDDLRQAILSVVCSDANFDKYFWTELCGFLKAKGVTDAQLYQAIGMSGSLFNSRKEKWAADVGSHVWESYTQRDYLLSMCIALQLNLLETKTLLAYGGQPLNLTVSSRDYVIVSCIHRGIYDPSYINDLLEDAGLAPLPIRQTIEQIRNRPRTRGKRYDHDPA